MSGFVIQTENLCRTYKSYQKQEGLLNSVKGFFSRKYVEKRALLPTTISIEPGQIVGLVGANGAGKTTLLKLLSGLIVPSEGEALVLGFRPWERKYDFLRKISLLLGQKNQLWWDLTPNDSFQLLTKIYGLSTIPARRRVEELSHLLDCEHVLQTQLRRLSLGERMKMEIIGALLHEPEVLFLDEPTIGLDIVAQSKIRDFLRDYVHKKSPTVILTSHYMDDIAILAHRLLLIQKGTIVYDGSVNHFMETTDKEQVVSGKFQAPLSKNFLLPGNLELNAGKKEFHLKIMAENLSTFLPALIQVGPIDELKIEKVDFEDVMHQFLQAESSIR